MSEQHPNTKAPTTINANHQTNTNNINPNLIPPTTSTSTPTLTLLSQLTTLNESLHTSLTHLQNHLQLTTHPLHTSLTKQRKALYDLLNYNPNLSLKQNYQVFMDGAMERNYSLTDRKNRLEERSRELARSYQDYEEGQREYGDTKVMIEKSHEELKGLVDRLEGQRLMRVSVRQGQQLQQQQQYQQQQQPQHRQQPHHDATITNPNISPDHSHINPCPTSSHLHPQPTRPLSPLSSHPSSSSTTSSFPSSTIELPDTLLSHHPKSKEIINSLEKELNPLRLDEIIRFLEGEITALREGKLKLLVREKKECEGMRRRLMERHDMIRGKLERMKLHVERFRQERFGAC